MLFVGDDWAEGHHDIEIMDASGRALVKVRMPEGVEGIGRLHGLIAERVGPDADPEEVLIGIETDRGLRVAAGQSTTSGCRRQGTGRGDQTHGSEALDLLRQARPQSSGRQCLGLTDHDPQRWNGANELAKRKEAGRDESRPASPEYAARDSNPGPAD